jgi:hypothetical protein
MNSTLSTNKPTGFQKAQRIVKKARIGLCGVAGSGKTLSALKIALGICAAGASASGGGKRIALVDTENNSSVLYADRIDFDVLNIEPPFEIEKYIKAIHQAEAAGYDVLILDSISHAWAGEGGLLDTQGKLADGGMNSFTAWRKLTPQHNAFIEAMIRSKLHLIATMRSKMDYVVETNEKGKSVPKKVGLAPVQREGMDYEFDIVFDLDLNHNALSTKDRSSLFDGKLVSRPDEKIGKQILEWLERGQQPAQAANVVAQTRTPLFNESGALTGEKEAAAMLDAIRNATTVERLNSIEQSRLKGVTTKRLTEEQSKKIADAIVLKRQMLQSILQPKAA